MTLLEFAEKYYLHDSLITNINYTETEQTLDIDVEFCHWAQPQYCDTEPEVGMIRLKFSDVSDFSSDGLGGDIDYFSILDALYSNDTLKLNILDDFNDALYTLIISAKTVLVETL